MINDGSYALETYNKTFLHFFLWCRGLFVFYKILFHFQECKASVVTLRSTPKILGSHYSKKPH